MAGQGRHRCPSASRVEALVSKGGQAGEWRPSIMATHRKQRASNLTLVSIALNVHTYTEIGILLKQGQQSETKVNL